MRAVVQKGYGSPAAVLRIAEVDRPRDPVDDEVVIRVHAASVNFGDWAFVTGVPGMIRLAAGMRTPRAAVRGRDVAGTVEHVGPRVSRFRPGDEIFGEIVTGSYAEYATTPESTISLKPRTLTFAQAAALPIAAGTALQGIRDSGGVTPGQSVLVNGASGGVGTYAVQVAKMLGAEVTGVCSSRNLDQLRTLGADHVIDYAVDDFTRGPGRYDVILDLAGSHRLRALRRVLTPRGTLVLSTGQGGRWVGPLQAMAAAGLMSPFVSQRLRVLAAKTTPERLDDVAALADAGKLTPVIERSYTLDEVPEALRHFGEDHARGKLVISIH
ncbi:NAD(P)-dependent alcohol dehydrogenase [Leifsonia flava]|uniref:NAD(P)-dependent alcohol dehydrogenase n=1 Tax=Orlajensenia leifsoniae TaxID=2561933 RepID=A0A4Y9R0A7_9MICO|nr:NAD(P)-dependent alcohol dehydrogenase [Leifsonia flava]TFV98194.1 NAD(P)-dependent alcohol dehydrogenase [Leifsonia flava]